MEIGFWDFLGEKEGKSLSYTTELRRGSVS